MKTATLGFTREDGDIQVFGTLNNNDGLVSDAVFDAIVTLTRHTLELSGYKIEVFERQDAPDYVTPEGN